MMRKRIMGIGWSILQMVVKSGMNEKKNSHVKRFENREGTNSQADETKYLRKY